MNTVAATAAFWVVSERSSHRCASRERLRLLMERQGTISNFSKSE